MGAWLPHVAAWLSRSAAGDLQWQGGFPKARDLQWQKVAFQSAAKHLRGGRVFPVRFGKVEKGYALGAWLPHLAAWLSRSAAGDLQWQGGFPKAPRGIYGVARCFPSVSEG